MAHDPFSLNTYPDHNGFSLPEDLFPRPIKKENQEILELKQKLEYSQDKINKLINSQNQVIGLYNQLHNNQNILINQIEILKFEIGLLKERKEPIQTTTTTYIAKQNHKKRKIDLDIYEQLIKSRNCSDPWQEGMSKYIGITCDPSNKKWKINSLIFNINMSNIEKKELAEKLFEGIVKDYGVSFDHITRKGYKT
jgi:TolA-binding protein